MFVTDIYRHGLTACRDTTPDASPNMRSVLYGVQVDSQDSDFQNYNGGKVGEIGGWHFWDYDPAATGVFSATGDGSSDANVPGPRRVKAPDYMSANDPNFPQEPHPERRCGLWAQAVPAVRGEFGFQPICDENHKDLNYLPDNDVYDITGASVPIGFPGIVVAGTEIGKTHAGTQAQTKIFVPAGNALCIDDKSEFGLGTKVYQVKDDRYTDADTGEVASLDSALKIGLNDTDAKQVLINLDSCKKDPAVGFGLTQTGENILSFLSSKKGGPIRCDEDINDKHKISTNLDGQSVCPAHIDTAALYKMDNLRDGPLDFSTVPFPESFEESGAVPVTCAYQASSGKWKFFASQSLDSDSGRFRIAWDFDGTTDNSQGFSLGAEEETVWIDYLSARAVFFNTAGDDTIFLCRLVAKEFTRNGQTRKLYRVTSCVEDAGIEFRFLKAVDKNKRYYGLTKDASDAETIKTRGQENRVRISISPQWQIDGAADYAVLEVQDYSTSFNLRGIPLNFTPQDNFLVTGLYESTAKSTSGVALATYQRSTSFSQQETVTI